MSIHLILAAVASGHRLVNVKRFSDRARFKLKCCTSKFALQIAHFFAARIRGLCPLQKTFDLKQRNKDMGSMCLLLEYCINTVVLPAKVGSTDCDQDDLRMTLL